MFEPSQLVNAIKGSPKSQGGCECTFVPMDGKWGLKIFTNKDRRDIAFVNQDHLSLHNLAPKLGGKFEIEVPKGEAKSRCANHLEGKVYGFVTEVVEVMGEVCGEGKRYSFDSCLAMRQALKAEVRRIGAEFVDDHSYNIGIVDGRAIVIDTGGVLFLDRAVYQNEGIKL